MSIVDFLRARLDEDEQTARAQRVPHEWHQGPGDDPEWTTAEMVCMWPPEFHTPYEQDKHWRGLTVEGPELAAHIARHDPARVLREVEAKRRLTAEGLNQAAVVDGEWGCCHGPEEIEAGMCEDQRPDDIHTLRLLSLPYADHPDYDSSWAV